MYSGTTFHTKSGRVIGVHQKIDRVARRQLRTHIAHDNFPLIRQILHFEGLHGPDGVKRKSPAIDVPWHFVNPNDPNDHALKDMIVAHRHNLVEALRGKNIERAAFEAAWLAHAITDGLTPAHHYPLSEKIEELWGKPKEERLSVLDMSVIRGTGRRDTLRRNWEYWGAKGVWSTHFLFEWGVATAISTMRFAEYQLSRTELTDMCERGLADVFDQAVHDVYELDMYHTYWQKGWTTSLARQTRTQLVPRIIQVVCFAWYDAYMEANS